MPADYKYLIINKKYKHPFCSIRKTEKSIDKYLLDPTYEVYRIERITKLDKP